VVVRWGNSAHAGMDYAVNTPESIRTAANSVRSLIAMHSAKVNTLEFYREVPQDTTVYPILGRDLYHRAGLDIIWCNTPEEATLANKYFYTRYTSIDTEFRVHVFGDNIIRMFKKVPRETNAHDTIRTSKRGWGYHRVSLSNYTKCQETAIAAVKSLELMFGGVDIGWNREERKYVVFEVNTGPALNSVSLRQYASLLAVYLAQLEEVRYEIPSEFEGVYRSD
jgi:glutathione synthase/RimK-type ligase-like ATP-grasp enzyme